MVIVFYDEFLKNQNKEVAFTCFDVDGNGYVFTLPVANVSTTALLQVRAMRN